MNLDGLTVVIELNKENKHLSWDSLFLLKINIKQLTSLSREALMMRGLSDMTKSLLISTEGGGAWVSGAYWTFLIISFTELLLDK